MTTVTASTERAQRRRSFGDLSVNIKVLTAVGVAALVALLVGINGIMSLGATSASAQHLYEDNLVSVKAVSELHTVVAQVRVDLANQVLSTDAASTTKFTQAVEADLAAFDATLAEYRDSTSRADQSPIDEIQTTWAAYVKVVRGEMLPTGATHNVEAWANLRDTKTLPLLNVINDNVEALEADETADAAASAAAAQAGYEASRSIAIGTLVVGLLLALGLGLLVARRIVQSLNQVKTVADALAAGDLTKTSDLTSRDESGQMGRALDAAVRRLRQTVTTIDSSAAVLATASEEMTSTATQISASAEETSAQAQTCSAAAEQVSRSVETVSAGSEEMGASIREISQNASEAARVAAEAVTVTAATSATMGKLGDSSAEIGNVIKVITSIAEQTNLLALNATIEAARAGDAGKGFAVVASEVKDLAQETARATEDISRRVQAIQSDTTGAVAAIEGISAVIARISDFQTTIASAVEEQTATTAEMNRSVSEAAGGAGEIALNITGVAEAARQTSQGISETQQAATEIARMSSELNGLVATFRF